MRILSVVCVLLICFSCKNISQSENKTDVEKEEKPTNDQSSSTQNYQNNKWKFSLKYPENFILLESELPGETPVINIYKEDVRFNPPFAIHEESENAYIAIMPEGFGVDAPSGKQISFKNSQEELNLKSGLILRDSKVYLLESGEAWAYFLRFKNPPGNWKKYGGIFVHFPVQNFEARCLDSSGNQKLLENCDPMGEDEIRYSGNIDEEVKSQMMNILKSFQFKVTDQKPISDLIKIEKPLPSMDVSSPLAVKGKARGYWFFEASASIEIQNKDYNTLAKGHIQADEKWTTEDFVNFSGSIEFEAPDDERGYLVFYRANPSIKKENEREYRLPIIFPPE